MEEVDAFFRSIPPLKNEEELRNKASAFISKWNESGTPIVCVSSGGTTVSLERKCVRYIDNFSSGSRGATSTEHFLTKGYAVIFLYRSGSIQPFCRSFPENWLEMFELEGDKIHAKKEYGDEVLKALRGDQKAKKEGTLLKLEYTDLFQYLQLLQILGIEIDPVGRRGMFFSAAAVSDFYIPYESMVEHKIQSGMGSLNLQLAPVPKMLTLLRHHWCPEAFCVSFKLETDTEILLKKAKAALEKYGMHVVVANELETRKEKVVMVTPHGETVIEKGDYADVELPLVNFLVEQQQAYIAEQRDSDSNISP